MREPPEARADAIIQVVLELLEADGGDAVQVRTVARRARVSLATIYKLFGTREGLIVAALQRWMAANAYAGLTMPEPGESPYETMVRILRAVFEPWEQHPGMLVAYHRAVATGRGEELVRQGMAIVEPIVTAALPHTDPQYLSDVELIHGHVVRAVIARFANGEIAVTDILPILERTLWRLTTDNAVELAPARAAAAVRPEGGEPDRGPAIVSTRRPLA